MNILFQYTKRVLKQNKIRTAITAAGIVLSFALFTAVFTAISSGLHFMTNLVVAKNGDWHGVIWQCSREEEDRLAGQENLSSYTVMQNQGVGLLEGVLTEERPYAYVGGVDESTCDRLSVRLTAGRLPQNAQELLVPEQVLTAGMQFSLEDQVIFLLGERYREDGTHVRHEDSYYREQFPEQIRNASERTFTVVGFYDAAGLEEYSFSCHPFLTAKMENAAYTEDIYFKLKDIQDADDWAAGIFPDHIYTVNRTLLNYMTIWQGKGRGGALLYGVISVLCIVIGVASIALIYNAFSISLGERTKQFGLLKSIGATKKQIYWMVLMEVFLLCLIAIPLGVGLGCGGIWLTLKGLRQAFRAFQETTQVDIAFYTRPAYLLAAIVVGMLTVSAAAAFPAFRANRLTPIEGIRQNTDIRVRPGSVRGRGLAGRLFGFGGMLAHKYAGRNRTAYRAILFSMATSLVLFLTGGGFVHILRYMYNVAGGGSESSCDVAAFYDTFLPQEEQERVSAYLEAQPSIRDSAIVMPQHVCLHVDHPDVLTYEGKLYADNPTGGTDFSVVVCYVEEDAYQIFLEQKGFDPDVYLYGDHPEALVQNSVRDTKSGKYYAGKVFAEGADLSACTLWAPKVTKEHEQAEGSEGEAYELGFSLGACVSGEEVPYWGYDQTAPVLYLPMHALYQVAGEVYAPLYAQICLTASDAKEAEKSLYAMKRESWSSQDYTIRNMKKSQEFELALAQVVEVFLTGFVALLCLIALTNIANILITSVRLRTREYAMLKSVGIGRRTMLQFILLENASYCLKAYGIGSLIGAFLYHILLREMEPVFLFDYWKQFPYGYFLTALAAALGILAFAAGYTFYRTKKENVLEALRNEIF